MAKKKYAVKAPRSTAIKPKAANSAAEEAARIRREWMTLSGMDDAEITHWLEVDPPTNPAEEQAQLVACRKLKLETPSSEQLSQISTRY